MSISDDDLIEMAQASYRRQAARSLQTKSEHWPIIPDRLWLYEQSEEDAESVVAYQGPQEIRLRWTGQRAAGAVALKASFIPKPVENDALATFLSEAVAQLQKAG